jgi:hypothetical protein
MHLTMHFGQQESSTTHAGGHLMDIVFIVLIRFEARCSRIIGKTRSDTTYVVLD